MALDLYEHLHLAPIGDAPLVLAFHGTGGNERQFSGLVQEAIPGAGLVAPRGDVSEHGALRFFRRTAEGVYDMADLAERTAKMARFVAAHRDANPGRTVLALGYSNGANILASLLFQKPELFDGTVLMHPLIPWEPGPQPGLAGKAIFVTAGRADPICPWPGTERLLRYFEGQGAALEQFVHPGGHEIRPDEGKAVIAALGGMARSGHRTNAA